MASNTVAQFAAELKMSSDLLLSQLRKAGIQKQTAKESITKEDKDQLLDYLRRSHGALPKDAKNKIILTRREPGSMVGREPTQVTVRKKMVTIAPDSEPNPIPKTFPADIQETDSVLQTTRTLLSDGFAGVILFGPPGTSKSWYARQIAARLVDEDIARVRFIQFHPAYQYEDFMEAYTPTKNGKFQLTNKVFLDLCQAAQKEFNGKTCVLVIDELSRCDVARVFGEALTYLEAGKRNIPFQLSSGRTISIPSNLVIIATMNPWDRGVDEMDAALERRFAKIPLSPNLELLKKILSENQVAPELQGKVERFFNVVKNHDNPLAQIGHAYFRSVKDEPSLMRLWLHQLSFHFERAFRLDPLSYKQIEETWQNTFRLQGEAPFQAANDGEVRR